MYRWFQVRRLSPPATVKSLLAPRTEVQQEVGWDGWASLRERLRSSIDLPETLTRSLPVLESAAYLSPVLLRDSDAMSMYHSLELRVPFLDSDIVRLALRSPLSAMVGPEGGKLSLRKAIAGHVPKSCLQKRKQGFGVPMGAWLWHSAVRQDVFERFHDLPRLARDFFEPSAMRALVKGYYKRSVSRRRYRLFARVWMVYMLLRWLDTVGSAS